MTVTGTARPASGTPLLGIAMLTAGVWVAAGADSIAKFLGSDMHVLQIVWARYAFAMIPLLPMLVLHMRPKDLARHFGTFELVRGLALGGITVFYFSAIQFMPLADALGLLFLYPLVATALASIFLGERVGRLVVALLLVSFSGAMLVIRPGYSDFSLGVPLAVLAALSVAVNIVINRHLAGSTPVFAGIVFATLIGLALSSLAAPFVWAWPTAEQWVLLAMLGLMSLAVTGLLYAAFTHGPASVIAPFGYTEIVAATALGFLVFDDWPDAYSFAGIGLICAAGIVMAVRGRA